MEISTFAGPATNPPTDRKRVQITTPTGHLQLDLQQWRWLQALTWALTDECEPLPVELAKLGDSDG